jgi:hypothetical protein
MSKHKKDETGKIEDPKLKADENRVVEEKNEKARKTKWKWTQRTRGID